MLPNRQPPTTRLTAGPCHGGRSPALIWIKQKKAPPERGLLALTPDSRASLPFLLRLPLPRQPLRLGDLRGGHLRSKVTVLDSPVPDRTRRQA